MIRCYLLSVAHTFPLITSCEEIFPDTMVGGKVSRDSSPVALNGVVEETGGEEEETLKFD